MLLPVEGIITRAFRAMGGLNLVATLGKEKRPPLCVPDIDGKGRGTGSLISEPREGGPRGSGNFHVYYYAADVYLPQR